MPELKFPSKQEALYRTMHNSNLRYQSVCQGIIRVKYWIHLLEDRPTSILDVGCGNCKLLNFLRDMQYEDLTGLDIVTGPYDHETHTFVQHDLMSDEPLPFDDDTFDHCLCFDVIEHLGRRCEESIAEMIRVSDTIIGTIACFTASTNRVLHRTLKTPAEWIKIINSLSDKDMEYLVFDSCGRKTLFYNTKKETKHED